MERLTEKQKYKNGRRSKGDWDALSGADTIYQMTDKLAAYEDTGLTPEECKYYYEYYCKVQEDRIVEARWRAQHNK